VLSYVQGKLYCLLE